MKLLSEKLSIKERLGLGKKAGNLNELLLEDYSVPNGFVLKWSDRDIFEKELDQFIKDIGGYPLAVRSSGQLEDLGDLSFAGLYETYLDIENKEDLINAIKKCFESTQGERVEEYLKKAGLKKSKEELYESFSVLVQKMILPRVAGVAFSVDPLSGIEDHLYVESCEGVGEKLVSGEVTPNRYIFNHFNLESHLSENNDDQAILSHKNLNEISKLSRKLQAFYGRPQDIEWAIDKNEKLWLLQTRPITKITWRKDFGELTNADLKDGGISSSVCTPLMFSLYQKCMNISMPEYFKTIRLWNDSIPKQCLYHFYGRGYWSSGNVKKMLRVIPGYDEKSFDEDLGIMKDYGKKGPEKTGTNLVSLIKGIPVLLNLEKEFKNCFHESHEYIKNFKEFELNYLSELSNLKDLSTNDIEEKFSNMIREFFIPTETAYYRTIYNNSNLQSVFKESLEKLEKKLDIKINAINLFTGIDGISHLEIQKDLKLLHDALENDDEEEINRALYEFLTRHYHHGDRELDLLVPRWAEVPERVIELAKNYVHVPAPSNKLYLAEKGKVLEALNKVMFSTKKKNKFINDVEFVRSYLKLREQMRELSTCSYYIVRQYILELDKRWANEHRMHQGQDIFYYYIDEILGLIDKSQTEDNLIKVKEYRKETYQGFRLFEAPNDFGFGMRQSENTVEVIDGDLILRGIPCSPGLFEGEAIVAKSIDEIGDISDNSILITKFTDPGWTPTLGRVKGVVTEVGGVLSHAAVISREYGIPAVLNISSVTDRIKSGQKVEINGDEGTIIVRGVGK